MSSDPTGASGMPSTDSAPADSDSPGGLGRTVADRQRPLRDRRTPLAGAASGTDRPRPGMLGRRAFDFSFAAGLSLTSRRQMGMAVPGLGVEGLPVAPPAEWDDSFFDVEAPRTGNATLDHLILTQRREAAAKARPPVQRGLRRATARSHTSAGRNTGPGASHRRFVPEVAPQSRDLDIQRLVAGDGPDARPRAPRSGPQPPSAAFPGGSSGSTPGREARGRFGRPAPWQQHRSARFAPGPAAVDASASTRTHSGSSPSAQRVSERRSADAGRPSTTTGPLGGVALSEEVSRLAGRVLGVAPGAGGLELPRGFASLPPGIAGPSVATGRDAHSPVARMAERTARSAPDPRATAAAPGRLAAFGGAGTTDLPVGPGLVGGTSAASAPGLTPGSTAGPVSSRPLSVGSGGATTPPRSRPESVVDAPARARSIPLGEPALATLLRAIPPSLGLSAMPSRGARPSPSSPASSSSPASTPRAAGGPVSDEPTARLSGPTGAPRPPALADLPVVPGGMMLTPGSPGVASAAGPTAVSGSGVTVAPSRDRTAAPTGERGPARRTRGLGSVASMASASLATSSGGHLTPNEADGSARRSLRTLPDLGSVAPSSPAFGRTSPGFAPARPGFAPADPGFGASGAAAGGRDGAGLPSSSGRPVAAPRVAAGDAPVAPPAVVPADPGERFERVLADHRGPALERLPRRFAPIAKALVARPDRVRVSTGDASRKALAAVGKKAATAGDVVHLARPLDGRPESVDILAHELTHVAHPSPLVRFFDDDRSSKEEAMARQVGEIMAKAPVGSPPATPSPLQGGGPSGGQGADPNPSQGGVGRGAAGIASAAQGAAGGFGSGRGQGVASGFGSGQGPGAWIPQGGPAAAAPPGMLAPVAGQGSSAAAASGQGAGVGTTPPVAGAPPATAIDIDRLLDALEARVLRELERRGRRWPRPM